MKIKTHIIRIGSVVPNGVGGPNAGALDLIYSYLLQEFQEDKYDHININQIGDDLEEFIMKTGKNDIHINLRYPVFKDFENKSALEQNRIRLDAVHSALTKIAEHDDKLDINKLKAIRNKILANNFSFNFIYKQYANKIDKSLLGKIIISPEIEAFKIYISIMKNEEEKCKLLIYSGIPTDFYFSDLFFYGKWKNKDEFVISGKRSEIEIHVFPNECRLDFTNNLGSGAKAPLFELFKSDADKEKTLQEYINSLNPSIAAIISQSSN